MVLDKHVSGSRTEEAVTDHTWPPLVGAIEASSAMLSTTKNMPMQTIMVVQIAPAGPPLAMEKVLVTTANSQVFPKTTI